MLTKLLVGFAAVIVLCAGCHTLTGQMAGGIHSVTQTSSTIFVGQPLNQATSLLLASGAEDISQVISAFICYAEGQPRRELRWFRLRDGKWLSVTALETGEQNQFVVENLVLGDTNTDHIKRRGLKRYPQITKLELP